jgi:hypothetical protein
MTTSGGREPESITDRALAFANHGWPVFPCQPGSKEPATRHGFHDATTDPEQIASWWRRMPGANLAVATGAPGPDVLDVDNHGPAGNGFAALNQLKRAGLIEGASAIVATPSGGIHAYFTGSAQRNGSIREHHLDFRAAGGYVLTPPSQVAGRPYRLIKVQPVTGGLDWDAVTRLLAPQRRSPRPYAERGGGVSHLAEWVARQKEGNRNNALFWAACRAAETGDLSLLGDLANAAISTGLDERSVAKTIASARRAAGLAEPRREATS